MNIDKKEVLRYLGHRNQDIDKELDNLIDICIEEIKKESKPLYVYKIFDTEVTNDKNIKILGTNLVLKGKDIYNHLKDAKKCAIMAATLGVNIDNIIRILGKREMTRSIILDSSATDAIEKVCDEAEEEIKQIAKNEGYITNFRYSPGYGDLSIEIQPEIINVLNANKTIGLTTTESFILIPRKSVTAIIGFLDKDTKIIKKRGCEGCSIYHTCNYRKEGVTCGN